jgi:L-lactate utilization protein LutB
MESLQHKGVTFFVAVDGSDASEMAYQTIAKDVVRKDD